MIKKIFCNTYVLPFTRFLVLPLYILVGVYAGFIGGLREAALATVNACDSLLD